MKTYFQTKYSFRILGATAKEQEIFRRKFSGKKSFDLSIRPSWRDEKIIVISLSISTSARLNAVAATLRSAKIKGERCQVFVSLNTDIETSIVEVDRRYTRFLSEIDGAILFSYTVIVP